MTSVSSPSLDLDAFKDPALALGLVESINKLAPAEGMTLMEVCGTHTVSIARNGRKIPDLQVARGVRFALHQIKTLTPSLHFHVLKG